MVLFVGLGILSGPDSTERDVNTARLFLSRNEFANVTYNFEISTS